MNRILSLSIAALLSGATGLAFAESPKANPASQNNPASTTTTTTPPTDTDTTANDPYVHGQAVREQAQSGEGGQATAEVAHTQRDFMKFDSDKNGTLSRAELTNDTLLTAEFGTLDEDGDGILSRSEFNASVDLDDEDADVDDPIEDEE
jgi:hypothetical protein